MNFYRLPPWSAILFVLLSMSVAVLYHHSQQRLSLESIDIASIAQGALGTEIIKCQCVKPGQENSDRLKLDEANKCIINELDVTEWPPLFRLERGKKPTEFSSVCLRPVLHDKFQQSTSRCLHQGYLNVVYNYLGDLTNCLEIPQREFLAVIASDQRPDSLGTKSWDHFVSNMSDLDDSSCRNLRPVLQWAVKDPLLKSISEQAWHFRMTLEGTRKLAASTIVDGELPEHWESWVMMRALEASSVEAISEIRQQSSLRKIATEGPAGPKLVQQWAKRPYMQSLMRARDEFNALFKEGTCVPESFLQP